MNLIFTITWSIWLLSEIIINRRFHSKETDKKELDKGSIYFIWALISISIFIAIFVSKKCYVPLLESVNIKYFGILLIYIGIIIRFLVIKTLGRFFTSDVTIRKQHILKIDGYYKYLRHPSYSASLLLFIGFGIILNNLISLLLVFCFILTAFLIRIIIEEKVLVEYFGSQYVDYKKHTKRVIPFIY